MSKARPPKHKEEYMPSDEIKDFCNEILEAGTLLASMSGVSFPNAESVSNAISVCSELSSSTIWLGGGSPPT
jgi:hypothetical protein